MWKIEGNQFDFSITHSIDAPREIVYQVLADIEAYPDFISDLVTVQREGDLYHILARAAILTIPATISVRTAPARSIAFQLVEGPVDVLTGSWWVDEGAGPGETSVTLTVHVEAGARGEWLLRMTARYVQSKTDKLVAAFVNRVKEIQGDGGRRPERRWPGWISAAVALLKRPWLAWRGRESAQLARRAARVEPVSATSIFREEACTRTLEALAGIIIPADDFDGGAQGMGFPGVVEVRSRYQHGRVHLYTTGLAALDLMAQRLFGKATFLALEEVERVALVDAVRQGKECGSEWQDVHPPAFFSALWEDVVFLYCTHPETWERIGFPGPSFDGGGYPDASGEQAFMGRTHAAELPALH